MLHDTISYPAAILVQPVMKSLGPEGGKAPVKQKVDIPRIIFSHCIFSEGACQM